MNSQVKILVVDYDPLMVKTVTRLLEKMDYQVSPALSAELGLKKLEEEPYDLILLDLLMPGMDGTKFLESFPKGLDIPVIVMSGQQDISSKVASFDLGAVDYITKPFSSAILLARIEAKLRRS